VVAQLLERDPTLTPAQIYLALTCLAAKDRINNFHPLDTVSRNLLLQIVRKDSSLTCDPGAGCPSSCSGKGLCSSVTVGSSEVLCRCERGASGETCSESSACSSPIQLELIDDPTAFYYGWGDARLALMNMRTGHTEANMFDRLSRDEAENFRRVSRAYCVNTGAYTLIVTPAQFRYGAIWTMCGYTGGDNFYGTLTVTSPGICSIREVATKSPSMKGAKSPTFDPTISKRTEQPIVLASKKIDDKTPSALPDNAIYGISIGIGSCFIVFLIGLAYYFCHTQAPVVVDKDQGADESTRNGVGNDSNSTINGNDEHIQLTT
jgi:hypothetical protein